MDMWTVTQQRLQPYCGMPVNVLIPVFAAVYGCVVVTTAGWCCVISLYDAVKFRVKWDKEVNKERWVTKVIRYVHPSIICGDANQSLLSKQSTKVLSLISQGAVGAPGPAGPRGKPGPPVCCRVNKMYHSGIWTLFSFACKLFRRICGTSATFIMCRTETREGLLAANLFVRQQEIEL